MTQLTALDITLLHYLKKRTFKFSNTLFKDIFLIYCYDNNNNYGILDGNYGNFSKGFFSFVDSWEVTTHPHPSIMTREQKL